jgi:CubicO group peptidase (beta-lactamase class C family)/uncharacterized protein YraI
VTLRILRVAIRKIFLSARAVMFLISLVTSISSHAQQNITAEIDSSRQGSGRWYAASPATMGFDSDKLNSTIEKIGEMNGVQGFLLTRQGYLIEEQYWRGGARSTPHNLKSASKSIISTLVGIAIAKGYLQLDQPITEILSKAKDLQDPDKKKITINNLLTMTSGLESTSYQAYNDWILSRDWITALLQRPLTAQPGSTFQYSTGDTHILSAILAEATGMSTRMFAEKELFEPMGIVIAGWQQDPDGIYFGGNNLSLLPRDVMKFGQLYLDRGRWGGKQLVPVSWVEESTRETDNGPHETYGNYGYLWWVQSSDQGSFAAVGYGGQCIFVSPFHDTVIVILSTKDESKGDRWEAELFELLRDGVLGSLKNLDMPPVILASAEDTAISVQSNEPVSAVTIANINLRAEPNLNGQRLITIPKGSQLELTQRNGDWVFAEIDGHEGWLHWDYVDQLVLVSELVSDVPTQNLAANDVGIFKETNTAVNINTPVNAVQESSEVIITLRSQVEKLTEDLTNEQLAKGEINQEIVRITTEYKAQGRRLEEIILANEAGKSDLEVAHTQSEKLAEVLQQEQLSKQGLLKDVERLLEAQQVQAHHMEQLLAEQRSRVVELDVSQSEIDKLTEVLESEQVAKEKLDAELVRITREHLEQGQQIDEITLGEKNRIAELAVVRMELSELAAEYQEEQLAKQGLSNNVTRLIEAQHEQAQQVEQLITEQRSREVELASTRSQFDSLRSEINALQHILKLDKSLPRYRAVARINFRDSPALAGVRLRIIEDKTEFRVMDRKGSWLKAKVDGVEGWLHSDYAQEIEFQASRLSQQDLETELSSLGLSVRELLHERDMTKQTLSSVEGELTSYKAQLLEEDAERERIQAESLTLEKELKDLNAEQAKQHQLTNLELVGLKKDIQQERLAKQELSNDVLRLTEAQQTETQRLIDEVKSRELELEATRSEVAKLTEVLMSEQLAKLELDNEFLRLNEDMQQERLEKNELSNEMVGLTEAQQTETQRLVAGAQTLKVEFDESQSKVIKLTEGLMSEQLAKLELESDLASLTKEHQLQEQLLQKTRLVDAEIQFELAKIRTMLTKSEKELQQERLTNQALSQNLAELMASQQAHEQQLVTRTAAGQAELEISQSRIATLTEELIGEQSAKGEMRSEVDRLTEAYRAQGKQFEEIRLSDDTGKSQLAMVNTELTQLGKDLQQERLTNQALSQKVAQLMTSQQTQEQQLVSITETHKSELKTSQSKITTLTVELNGEQTVKGEMYTEFNRLTQAYRVQDQQIETLKLAEEKGKVELMTSQNKLANLVEDLQQERLAKQDLSTDVARLTESQKTQAQSSKVDLLRLSTLERELADAQMARDQSEQKLAKLSQNYQEQVQITASKRRDNDIALRTQANDSVQKSFLVSNVPEPLTSIDKKDTHVAERSDQHLMESGSNPKYASEKEVNNFEEVSESITDSEIEILIRGWAEAWSQQDVNEYLSYYTDDYRPANGDSHDAWRKTRHDRITRPTFVEVKISNISINVLDSKQAIVTFQQVYRADHFQDQVNKTFNLKRSQDKWRIVREIVHKS